MAIKDYRADATAIRRESEDNMKLYYFFDEYGECFTEKHFDNEEEASVYCEQIEAEYFCCD